MYHIPAKREPTLIVLLLTHHVHIITNVVVIAVGIIDAQNTNVGILHTVLWVNTALITTVLMGAIVVHNVLMRNTVLTIPA